MNQDQYDWSQFIITFYYPVSVEKLFETWTTANGLESFFIEECKFGSKRKNEIAEKGDSYNFQWRHDFNVSGEVLEVEKNKYFSYTFGSMKVSIKFEKTENGSMCFIHQENITEDNKMMGHLNCRSCWIFFMTNLKSVYMTATDLRDENPEIVSSMEVEFIPKELGPL
ncbi:MAG: SRPBCC domain-containing protein [Bacteriovoracaceae bacterium]|jgi:uncharacterized protein YndB with AHSA1/START domain|nr:SRPBCC domain-containing protein [Bacteriovoracaceae bacterium]